LTLRDRVWQRRNRLRNRFPKATLADVAERAGVSPSTASRALNGHAGLAPATRAAVESAAASLKFQPSPLARSLRTRRTLTVGFVVPDVSSPFYAAALKGAQRRLGQAGYRVLLMDASLDVERELAALETLYAHQVDGLLLATAGISAEALEAAVSTTPTVFFDSVADGAGDGAVILENARGTELLLEHLVGHGHDHIAFLAGSQRETSGVERLQAFRASGRADERYIRVCEWSIGDGRRAGLELLDDPRRASAVLASSAELALGFMAAAAERRLRIPQDVALVSFDDPYFGELLEPSLTAVAYDACLVGERAAALLVDAMSSETDAREVRVPVTLVTRRSCGCDG
jgi:LacI family transcriptional regulator, galactose operon repressor